MKTRKRRAKAEVTQVKMSIDRYRPLICTTDVRSIGQAELAELDSSVAYICEYSPAKAREIFPELVSEIKDGVQTYALFRGDGQVIMITDDRWSAVARADEDDWEVIPWLH